MRKDKKLNQAYFDTKDSTAIFELDNMAKSSDTKRTAAIVFTRTFENMSDETAEQILKVLQNNVSKERINSTIYFTAVIAA